ncbi:MAG: heat-inducible transcriptional repressor HrcA [Acutalibacteraceae bacterium]|nr:heat-inducible transcriptional repressor HrcA [Acutalibacteraceae bacterium]
MKTHVKEVRFVELSARKQAILTAIVKAYISTGEPIGSKILCEMLDNSPSSATLRNEMSELVKLGFLEQPHTSAGRMPTAKGYKFYIESSMQKNEISEEHKRIIDSFVNSSSADPEHLPEKASQVLSEITGLPTICANISEGGPKLRRVDVLPMGMHSGMIIVITSDGRSRSRLCHLSSGFTSGLISKFDRLVNDKLIKKSIDELTPAVMQSIFIEAGSDALTIMPLFSSLFEMITDLKNAGVSLAGQSNLFTLCPNKDDADKIISIINKRESLLSLLSGTQDPLEIVFGDQTGFSALQPSSLIIAKYGIGKNNVGCIGVIGPTRMSYEHIIPSIEYTASRLNNLLSVALKDMEEN